MADSFSDEASGTSQIAAAPAPSHSAPLLDDPNDDFCRVCGFGVSSNPDTPPKHPLPTTPCAFYAVAEVARCSSQQLPTSAYKLISV